MLKGMRTLFALEIWTLFAFRNLVEYMIKEKLQSFKNSIEDKAGWVATIIAYD